MELLSDYQVSVIRQVWILLLYYPLVSVIYYANSKSVTQSAHGVLALAGFFYAVIACEFTEFAPPDYWYWPIYICAALALASVLYSFKAFKGKKVVHLIHAVTLVSVLLSNFVALMAVSHDWV
ncbi:MAG: hypothetical protein V7721_09740 [Porticoccaceae bacterium]